MNAEMRGGSASRSSKTVHVQISVHTLQTPPENDEIYGRIDPADPEVVELAKGIAKQGVLEPLVVSADGFVVSGNRRLPVPPKR